MKKIILLIAFAVIAYSPPAFTQQYYQLQTVTGTGGGSFGSSSAYRSNSTVGQAGTASAMSSGYYAGEGFWQQNRPEQPDLGTAFGFSDSWNLISVPKFESDYRTRTLFPTAISRAYAYVRGEQPTDVLRHGQGYWLKFSNNQIVILPGTTLNSDTVAVENGWNIIGSVGGPVDINAITEIPSGIVITGYYAFDGGYTSAATLNPSKGYWVKCSAAGSLVLNAENGQAPSTIAVNANFNVVTVSPAATGKSTQHQSLYFAASLPEGKTADSYEMPPAAPAGLDARFASNRSAEFFSNSAEAQKEIPLAIRTDAASVIISWTMKEHTGQSYILVEKQGNAVIAQHTLASDGSVTIGSIGKKILSLKLADKPVAYALAQNFPNPFNPSTVIQYSLPSAGHVSLKVYNTLGQEVATLIDAERRAGYQSVQFNASNYASGVYFYRITAGSAQGGFTDVKKMLLLK
jgi:hypothetical protein